MTDIITYCCDFSAAAARGRGGPPRGGRGGNVFQRRR